MSGHILAACLALVAAFIAGTVSDPNPGPTGLGGPHGGKSLGWFIIATLLLIAAFA